MLFRFFVFMMFMMSLVCRLDFVCRDMWVCRVEVIFGFMFYMKLVWIVLSCCGLRWVCGMVCIVLMKSCDNMLNECMVMVVRVVSGFMCKVMLNSSSYIILGIVWVSRVMVLMMN